ncbi:hypothetical protein [Hymenobacter properus]|uniref:GLPGLI family protein n=1 Tax=Hymenobacter properus TaxID=2791026 RepID=A0A931BE87_9BACT|nr:hypothetical protein [Hymenobacter properus]MBF9142265.1 hypothetical protein [Hymenobacter properus]MBR7721072.1 hypothetical protein [Microvirga sp. SRT04]
MKPVLLLLLALLLKLPAGAPLKVRVTLSPLTKTAYEQAKKAAIVTKPTLTFPLKKHKGRIVIPTAKGPKVFQDVQKADDETATTTYQYLGYLEKLRLHVLQIQLWETSEYELIDARGNITELWSPPTCSPQMQYLMTVSGSLEYEMMPNGLQLFRCAPVGLQKVWELAPTTWAPDEASTFWASESTVFIKQKRYPKQDVSKKPYFTYAKLTIH